MGNSSCYYTSSGNASASCNSNSLSDTTFSTGAIIGTVIGCVVAILLIVIVAIVIYRCLLMKQRTVNAYPQPNVMNNHHQKPHSQQQIYMPQEPPSYTEATTNFP